MRPGRWRRGRENSLHTKAADVRGGLLISREPGSFSPVAPRRGRYWSASIERTDPGNVHTYAPECVRPVHNARGQCKIIIFVESAKNGRFADTGSKERLHRVPFGRVATILIISPACENRHAPRLLSNTAGSLYSNIYKATFSTRQRRHKLRRHSVCDLIAFAISSGNTMGDKILLSHPLSRLNPKYYFTFPRSRSNYFDSIYNAETSVTVGRNTVKTYKP